MKLSDSLQQLVRLASSLVKKSGERYKWYPLRLYLSECAPGRIPMPIPALMLLYPPPVRVNPFKSRTTGPDRAVDIVIAAPFGDEKLRFAVTT
jgi:hypothetical protein